MIWFMTFLIFLIIFIFANLISNNEIIKFCNISLYYYNLSECIIETNYSLITERNADLHPSYFRLNSQFTKKFIKIQLVSSFLRLKRGFIPYIVHGFSITQCLIIKLELILHRGFSFQYDKARVGSAPIFKCTRQIGMSRQIGKS